MSGYHFERCERQVKTEAHYCVETDGYRQKKAQGWLVLEQRRKAEEEERLRMRGEAHVFEEGDVAVCKEGEADMRCSVVAVVEVESVSASKARQREFVGRLQHCAVVFARSHRGQLGNEVPEGCLDVNHRFKGRRVYWTTNDELVPVQVEKMDELRLLELPLPFLVRLFVHLSTLDGLQLALSCQRLHGVRNLELHWHCAPSNRVFVATSLPGSFYVDRPLRGVGQPTISFSVNPEISLQSFLRDVMSHPKAITMVISDVQGFDPTSVGLKGSPDVILDMDATSVATCGLRNGAKLQAYQRRYVD